MNKFKVGDEVLISSNDNIYFWYDELARKIGLKNFREGNEPITLPLEGVVVASSEHLDPYETDTIYGVRVGDKEYLVSVDGLTPVEKVESVEPEQTNESVTHTPTIGGADSSAHYISDAMQPIEIMQMTFSREEFIGFLKGNIIKYSFRAGKKAGESAEKDYNKVKQYKLWLDIVLNGEAINPRIDVI